VAHTTRVTRQVSEGVTPKRLVVYGSEG
jgi:hypothetical protein